MMDSEIKVFFSHMADFRAEVERVNSLTSVFGIMGFVAHTGIEPGLEWEFEIVRELDACKAFVAFLHKGFSQRPYCNHEVGWAKARRIPILPLNFGEKSSGMIASIQSSKEFVSRESDAAFEIVKWLMNDPSNEVKIRSSAVIGIGAANDWEVIKILIRFFETFGLSDHFDPKALVQARNLNPKFRSYYPLVEDADFSNWINRILAIRS